MAKKPKESFKVTTYEFSEVDKHIGDVTTKAKTLKVKIHSLAVTILKHWHDNPQDGPICAEKMNALMNASPYHTRAFSQWVGMKGQMKWSEETKSWYVHRDDKIRGKEFMDARDNPFWEVSPPPEAKPFIMAEAIERIIKQVEKHEKKPVDGDVFDKSAVKHLRDALNVLNKG